MGEFCLLVKLHQEGSALQPAQQACFSCCAVMSIFIQEPICACGIRKLATWAAGALACTATFSQTK